MLQEALLRLFRTIFVSQKSRLTSEFREPTVKTLLDKFNLLTPAICASMRLPAYPLASFMARELPLALPENLPLPATKLPPPKESVPYKLEAAGAPAICTLPK